MGSKRKLATEPVQAVGRDGRTTVFLPLTHPERFQVYEPSRLLVAVGDTIQPTLNGKTEDGHNGQQRRALSRDGLHQSRGSEAEQRLGARAGLRPLQARLLPHLREEPIGDGSDDADGHWRR